MTSPTRVTLTSQSIEVEYAVPGIDQPQHAIFLALGFEAVGGHARVPFGRGLEGSTVFLPFKATQLYAFRNSPGDLANHLRRWERFQWSAPLPMPAGVTLRVSSSKVCVSIPLSLLGPPAPQFLKLAVWAKDMHANDGWGWLLANPELTLRGGINDQTIDGYYAIDFRDRSIRVQTRRGPGSPRVRVYQLLPRLFSNTNSRRKPNGTLVENGVGKFNDLNATALGAIKAMNFTHIWLTGIHCQATSTDYSSIGLPADKPDLLKGLAGSPYAIRDYFDVCPDYAVSPRDRLAEFEALVQRAHAAGLRVIIDFVGNHVARSYHSTVRPELTFGSDDDHTTFFDPRNNFFWLPQSAPGGGPPLRLPSVNEHGELISPTCRVLGRGDGICPEEREHGRVTGNNVVSWRPSLHDWYETVKLNYGFDFTSGHRAYPCAQNPSAPIPDTWLKMDAVLAWWQSFGVDGFRCDMAHMVPPDFWGWAIDRARQRNRETFFAAEAYDNDPMKVGTDNVMVDLLNAGFDAVYDDPSYKSLKGIYDGARWANDLDSALASTDREYVFLNSLRYAENHDEVRLAGRNEWGRIGPNVGRSVSAILYGAGRGPVLLYSGQEVGEPADGAEGFGGDDARTTIFDYWSMPEVARWVNDHRYDGGQLTAAQTDLRSFYIRLLALVGEPAFRDGEFFALNYANIASPAFGRADGEGASGHWLYAFLRSDRRTGQRYLVVANLHPSQTLRDVRVRLPREALEFVELTETSRITAMERLSTNGLLVLRPDKIGNELAIGFIPPLTPYYFELQIV